MESKIASSFPGVKTSPPPSKPTKAFHNPKAEMPDSQNKASQTPIQTRVKPLAPRHKQKDTIIWIFYVNACPHPRNKHFPQYDPPANYKIHANCQSGQPNLPPPLPH
ncbi:hypothetical protein KFK09_021670 [Dendrobium nobile]|uniref:Uncharacterized protein n=1 Tax=Dendrobium nobile TaxID=94219 RepID=A0A8T3AQR7_DENNO|nr:hypothetical protein KFK09_021670 [Dendrobium nobile]